MDMEVEYSGLSALDHLASVAAAQDPLRNVRPTLHNPLINLNSAYRSTQTTAPRTYNSSPIPTDFAYRYGSPASSNFTAASSHNTHFQPQSTLHLHPLELRRLNRSLGLHPYSYSQPTSPSPESASNFNLSKLANLADLANLRANSTTPSGASTSNNSVHAGTPPSSRPSSAASVRLSTRNLRSSSLPGRSASLPKSISRSKRNVEKAYASAHAGENMYRGGVGSSRLAESTPSTPPSSASDHSSYDFDGAVPSTSASVSTSAAADTQPPSNSSSTGSNPTDPINPSLLTTGNRRTRVPPPLPVPNLTKRSRGRKVPILVPPAAAAMTTGKAPATPAATPPPGGANGRIYVCTVKGCSKCFARREHLKRHVRSIHTNEKRTFPLYFFPLRSLHYCFLFRIKKSEDRG